MTKSEFRRDVEINGLPYIFKGAMPIAPSVFEWDLVTPDMENYSYGKSQSEFFDSKAKEFGYCWYNNAAGYLDVRIKLGEKSFYLATIRSNTHLLAEKLRHHNARGVGSFLLKSLVALADIEDKMVYVWPAPDRQGKLAPEQVIAWYERSGFKYLPLEEQGLMKKMVRYPSQIKSPVTYEAALVQNILSQID